MLRSTPGSYIPSVYHVIPIASGVADVTGVFTVGLELPERAGVPILPHTSIF